MILPFKDYLLTKDINTSYELMTTCITKDCSFYQYFLHLFVMYRFKYSRIPGE